MFSRSSIAVMGSLLVVILDPLVQILLQLFDGAIDLLPKSNAIKLLLNRFAEALTNAIVCGCRLWSCCGRCLPGPGKADTRDVLEIRSILSHDWSACAATGCRVHQRRGRPGH